MIKKGVILAGGNGTRLLPATRVTNKHLLPVFDRPMIFFPIETLKSSGVREILIICGPDHAGDFAQLLGDGSEFDCSFTFKIQRQASGIAHGLALAENFAGGENLAVILGDNIFLQDFANEVQGFKSGARIFLKKVEDAQRFGVAVCDERNRVLRILEKPQDPPSNFAVTGFYLFDNSVFKKIKQCQPSARGELEITDVNNAFIAENAMTASFVQSQWTDAGTHESFFRAAVVAREFLKES